MYISKFVAFFVIAIPCFLIGACDNSEGDSLKSSSLVNSKTSKIVAPLKNKPLHSLSFQQNQLQGFDDNNAPAPANKEEIAKLLIGTPFESALNNTSVAPQEANLPTFESPSQPQEVVSASNNDNSDNTNNAPAPASKEEIANLLIGTPFESALNNASVVQQEANLPTFESAVKAFYASKKQQ